MLPESCRHPGPGAVAQLLACLFVMQSILSHIIHFSHSPTEFVGGVLVFSGDPHFVPHYIATKTLLSPWIIYGIEKSIWQ